MIICAALLVQVEGLDHETIIPCWRHGKGYEILKDLGFEPRKKYKVIAEGFIDHAGKFWDRASAFVMAKQWGQLSQTTLWYKEDHNQFELYSEDLY